MTMRTIFSALALLVVLSAVGTVGMKKADALNSGTVTTGASTAGSALR